MEGNCSRKINSIQGKISHTLLVKTRADTRNNKLKAKEKEKEKAKAKEKETENENPRE